MPYRPNYLIGLMKNFPSWTGVCYPHYEIAPNIQVMNVVVDKRQDYG